jgi:ABC-type tungstate transport system permease subunit
MRNSFQPHFEILPPAQLLLWKELNPVNNLGFVLYGGTALALRLGHRVSIDFVFFHRKKLRS